MNNQEKSSVRPLPKRVLAIRNDECAQPMNLYMQKYISADKETSLAKDLLINNMYEPVTVMITRAILYAYMGFRSIYSFVAFFRSLYCNLTTAIGRSALKTWFLEALQQREYLHYNCPTINKERHDRFLALINGILNDRLVDKADCVTYLSGPTLEQLNIIPCATRFDRRCERLKMAPMNQQDKRQVSKAYNRTLAKKLVHHYLLNTMEIDNTMYGYAVIPLSEVGEYNKLFRSYLVGDDKLAANVVIDIMIDLFMDEVQHNYSFWMEMIKQNTDLNLTRLSTTADDKLAPSSADKETPDHTNKSILADLLVLKLNHASTSNTTIPWAVYYTSALLIKEDLLDMDTLLYHHHQQDSTWVTPLAMAMFSIGDHTRALSVLKKAQVTVSGSLCDWLQRSIVARITSWLTDQSATKPSKATTAAPSTKPTKPTKPTTRKSRMKKHKKRRLSPLSQVSLPHDVFYVDLDTDDEDVIPGNYDNQHINLCTISPARTEDSFDSTSTAINTIADDKTVYHNNSDDDSSDKSDNSDNAFDYFSKQFFYQQRSTSLTALQLLTDFIVPCMVAIGGTQMAASPNTMNNIIILIHHALRVCHQPQNRNYLAELFTTYIFPVLSFTVLEDLHECLQLLTTDERLDVYLRWLDSDSDDTLRAYRDQAKYDVEDFLNSIPSTSPISSPSLSFPQDNNNNNDDDTDNALNLLARHHPIDVAQVILDRVEKISTDDDNKSTSIMAAAADLICGDEALVRDGFFTLLAHRLLALDNTPKQTTENTYLLMASRASLQRFSRYLLNDRLLSSTAIFPSLTSKPGFSIDHGCGLDSNPLQRSLSKKRSASVLATSHLTNKKPFRSRHP